MELIVYFANDGDISSTDANNSNTSTFSSPKHQVEEELVSVDTQEGISQLSESQHEYVNELLSEAMEEEEKLCVESNIYSEYFYFMSYEKFFTEFDNEEIPPTGARLFYFPDEKHPQQDNIKPLPQVTYELGDVAFHSNKSSDTDDEFCIIGNEASLGILVIYFYRKLLSPVLNIKFYIYNL